jgi:hypothetical protein
MIIVWRLQIIIIFSGYGIEIMAIVIKCYDIANIIIIYVMIGVMQPIKKNDIFS